MSNPATYDQTTKVLDLIKPLSNDRGKLQILLESGFLSDLVEGIKEGVIPELVNRNNFRKALYLPHFVSEDEAISILGKDHVITPTTSFSAFGKELIIASSPAYLNTTLEWAAKQNEGGANFCLIYVPELSFNDVREKLFGSSGVDFLPSETEHDALGPDGDFSFDRFLKKWDGYYLVDVSGNFSGRALSTYRNFYLPLACVISHVMRICECSASLPRLHWKNMYWKKRKADMDSYIQLMDSGLLQQVLIINKGEKSGFDIIFLDNDRY